MNKCSTCKHWQIIPSHESARTDRGMTEQGYKNCLKGTGQLNYARFVHMNFTCKKYEVKND